MPANSKPKTLPPDQIIYLWPDPANDRFRVTWTNTTGTLVPTNNPDIMVELDADGRIAGFIVDNFSKLPQPTAFRKAS